MLYWLEASFPSFRLKPILLKKSVSVLQFAKFMENFPFNTTNGGSEPLEIETSSQIALQSFRYNCNKQV